MVPVGLSQRAAKTLRTAVAALALATVGVLFPGAVLAQESAPPTSDVQDETVEQALGRAEEALATAIASGQTPHPDQPAWSHVYETGEAAVEVARATGTPQDLRAALLLSARGYGLMQWHARAFARFDEYITEGGELIEAADPQLPSDLRLFVDAANQLAYSRYQAGDHVGATGYYLTVLELAPDDPEALRWLARIAFERGDGEGARVAVGLWERLLEVEPDDESARYYLERSQQRTEVGVAASDSFHAGLAAYQEGDLEGALNLFQAALTANQGFTDAEVWAGRIALELGLPELAVRHWRNVLAARPEDAGAAHFLRVAQTQAQYGVPAGERFFEGLAHYDAGDLEAATAAFVAATQAAPAFVDAWVWAARSLQEGGQATESVPYWETVLELTPGDERAAWFLRRATLATERGDVAGPAFFDAVAAYEAGDADRARALLEEAVAADPEFVEAWGYLGRIAFQQGRYLDAAEAYGRAAELSPGVDEYVFFAEEAARLAGADEESDDVDGEPVGEETVGEEADDDVDYVPADDEDEDAGPVEDEPSDGPEDDEGVQPLPPGAGD